MKNNSRFILSLYRCPDSPEQFIKKTFLSPLNFTVNFTVKKKENVTVKKKPKLLLLLDSVLFHGSICLYLLNHCLDYCGFITSLVIYLFLKLFILYWGEAY